MFSNLKRQYCWYSRSIKTGLYCLSPSCFWWCSSCFLVPCLRSYCCCYYTLWNVMFAVKFCITLGEKLEITVNAMEELVSENKGNRSLEGKSMQKTILWEPKQISQMSSVWTPAPATKGHLGMSLKCGQYISETIVSLPCNSGWLSYCSNWPAHA